MLQMKSLGCGRAGNCLSSTAFGGTASAWLTAKKVARMARDVNCMTVFFYAVDYAVLSDTRSVRGR